jgi:uncharacterized protein
MKTKLSEVNEFLGQKRIAVVGVSRDPKDFTRVLFKELQQRNYEVVPVNPNVTDIEGVPCYASVDKITPAVDGVLIMTPPQVTEQVVQDCGKAGVRRVWLHRGAGVGAVSPKAVEYCEQQGMKVVAGYCPFMFLSGTPFFHKFHGFTLKVTGKYPSKS